MSAKKVLTMKRAAMTLTKPVVSRTRLYRRLSIFYFASLYIYTFHLAGCNAGRGLWAATLVRLVYISLATRIRRPHSTTTRRFVDKSNSSAVIFVYPMTFKNNDIFILSLLRMKINLAVLVYRPLFVPIIFLPWPCNYKIILRSNSSYQISKMCGQDMHA